jgi:hypothetical protein
MRLDMEGFARLADLQQGHGTRPGKGWGFDLSLSLVSAGEAWRALAKYDSALGDEFAEPLDFLREGEWIGAIQ